MTEREFAKTLELRSVDEIRLFHLIIGYLRSGDGTITDLRQMILQTSSPLVSNENITPANAGALIQRLRQSNWSVPF